jgi:hypothetical protein
VWLRGALDHQSIENETGPLQMLFQARPALFEQRAHLAAFHRRMRDDAISRHGNLDPQGSQLRRGKPDERGAPARFERQSQRSAELARKLFERRFELDRGLRPRRDVGPLAG